MEEAWALPKVQSGFASMQTFMPLAQEVLQRRKVRSGLSLELHTRTIFREEGLVENRDFAYNRRSEGKKRPDFLFPSAAAYRRPDFPASRLRMLAVKTTCKDRWRQILNEADRIDRKHLLTLQEGISQMQFREMNEANVQLVIPRPLIGSFQMLSSRTCRPWRASSPTSGCLGTRRIGSIYWSDDTVDAYPRDAT